MSNPIQDPRNPEVPATLAEQLALHIKVNARMYIASAVVAIVVFSATAFFRLNQDMNAQAEGGAYAAAIGIEDPVERMAALGAIADGNSTHATKALYLEGHTALEIPDFEAAEAAFNKLRLDHPDFEFTPDAVEGLGIIKRQQGDHAAAIAVFQDVMATWPDSFAALRQPYNIAQCHEDTGNLEEAIKAYQEQLVKFPDSNVALRAETEINRLRAQNPQLDTDTELVTIDSDTIQ